MIENSFEEKGKMEEKEREGENEESTQGSAVFCKI